MADDARIARIFREESGRVVAHLIRRFGDISLAEEAVQDAFVRAAERWPVDGIPPNPGGWITTTARNRALDVVRRESQRTDRHVAATRDEPTMHDDPSELAAFDGDDIADERLRLIFTCCHPALAPEARVALTLRLLGGLTTPEIARAFLVPEPTMAARITRAKKKIEAANIPYRVPAGGELPDRLGAVMTVLYLVFNEGYFASAGESLVRTDLSAEAIRLTRVVVALMPDEPEPLGLLALMLLTEARRPARLDTEQRPVMLADQDRSVWDRALIAEGHDLVRRCLRRGQPGPYQVQAAIAAVHADAPTAARTDWGQIVALYDQLLAFAPSDVVRLNRAIAIAERDGADAGLALLDELDLDTYGPYHVSRAELLRRTDRFTESRAAYDAALALTANAIEQDHLRRRRASVR
ncbi:MAG TPA: sigma-70 family RNA polymerase sigma factor [Ilumatobacter sp.]|nr:sigma-70 family RNA polymerase sigma factor [Ilumatobacter sp.]